MKCWTVSRVWHRVQAGGGSPERRCEWVINLQGGPAKVRPTYIFDGNIW